MPRVLRLRGSAGLLQARKFAPQTSSQISRESAQGMRVMRALLVFYARGNCSLCVCPA